MIRIHNNSSSSARWLWMLLLITLIPLSLEAQQAREYMPLQDGAKWVLRHPGQKKPVVFEVVSARNGEFEILATNPWGASRWTLEYAGEKLLMTRFGTNEATMPLADRPIFADFSRKPGESWENSLGRLQMEGEGDTVALRHRPKGGNQYFVFQRGVGFVQYGEGKDAFRLVESESRVPSSLPVAEPAPAAPSRTSAAPRRTPSARSGALPIGITFNCFANETCSPQTLLSRFEMTAREGISLLVAGATWAELEKQPGRINLQDLSYLASISTERKLPVVYTLRVIDTIHKSVPPDLRREAWNSPKMKSRALEAVESLVPAIGPQLRWFHFGYEVDGYFQGKSNEIEEFADLYRTVAARLRQIAPGVRMSSTVAFMNLERVERQLAPLNREWDHLAVTYTPILPGWVAGEPESLPKDFQRMAEVAAGRGIVFQEIAYPSSPLNRGSEEKQARFIQLAFEAFQRHRGEVLAANFMTLADLSDQQTEQYGQFYGLPRDRNFKAMLQTLGLHDTEGRPKPAWEVFRQNMQRPRR